MSAVIMLYFRVTIETYRYSVINGVITPVCFGNNMVYLHLGTTETMTNTATAVTAYQQLRYIIVLEIFPFRDISLRHRTTIQ